MDENINRLSQLNQQTKLKSGHERLEKIVRTPLYTQRIQEYPDPYQRTNQLDKNNNLSLFQQNTQNLKYDKVICGRQKPEEKYRYNYAIDKNITNKLVDVSGQMIRNSDLRVQPNRYITPTNNNKSPIGL